MGNLCSSNEVIKDEQDTEIRENDPNYRRSILESLKEYQNNLKNKKISFENITTHFEEFSLDKKNEEKDTDTDCIICLDGENNENVVEYICPFCNSRVYLHKTCFNRWQNKCVVCLKKCIPISSNRKSDSRYLNSNIVHSI